MKRITSLAFAILVIMGATAQQQLNFPAATPAIEDPHPPAGIIKGRVTTTEGLAAAGVTIVLAGTNRTTTTNDNGHFELKGIKEGNYQLDVSMVGLQTVSRSVSVSKEKPFFLELVLAEDAKQLAQVVVSSAKTINKQAVSIGKAPIDPMDMPQSITVLGQGVLRDQQAQRLSDVIKNVNGVYLSTNRASTQENFSARGYAFGNTNLFKNGARVNSGAMPEMSSLEKVEVLKGSTAILYGQVAPGGVLNMVTKQPKFHFGGEVSFRAGSYDLYKPAFDLYGPISSSLAYRVNGTFESAGSYRNGVSSDRYYINPSLLFKPGAKTEILLEGDYLKHQFTPDFGTGSLADTVIPEQPRSRFLGTPWQYAHTDQATATASVKHQWNENWQLSGSLSYQKYQRDYFSTERIQAKANGNWTRPLGRTYTEEDYYTGQLNLTGKFRTGNMQHTLLAGFDADRYLTSNDAFSIKTRPGMAANTYDSINILDPNRFPARTDIPEATPIRRINLPVDRGGVYAQDLIKISPRFNVLAGLRWSYVYSDRPDSTNLATGKKTEGKSKYDQAFSPRLGLVYKPTEYTSLFLSYANSFTVNTGVDVQGNALAPSIVDQYEAGIKNEFFNGKLSANLTLYRIKNNNLAQTAPFEKDGVTPNNNTAIRALVGETTSDGAEIDLAGHPVAGLDIIAGYSYNSMRYTKTPNTKGSFLVGERLVNTPAHTANGSVFYTFRSTGLKGLKIGASAFYVGKRFGGWNNTLEQAQKFDRLIPVEGFTTFDVSAGYSYKKLSFLAKLSNLTNTYNFYLHENYSINPIAPRQLVGTIAYKF